MFKGLRAWFEKARTEKLALQLATREFEASRGSKAMGGHILQIDACEAIVRVMFMRDCIPADRAWFYVDLTRGNVHELSFEEVAHLESPWR